MVEPPGSSTATDATANAPADGGPEPAAGGSSTPQVDLANFRSEFPWRHRLGRALWNAIWLLLFRPSPAPLHGWRRFLLRCFGATMARTARVYPSAIIWAPWNLRMDEHSTLGPQVDCYSVARVYLEPHTIVSQYAYLCTASHDYEHPQMPLTTGAITIRRGAWVTAAAFVGPGVTIGEGAVVGARAVVMKDVGPWTVVAGNPARVVKTRTLRDPSSSP